MRKFALPIAMFLTVLTLAVPAFAADTFTDDNGSVHELDIEALAAMNVTDGCTPTMFCPEEYVTRGQMAKFLRRLLDLPASPVDYFPDDQGHVFENDINATVHAGITFGLASGFAPDAPLMRVEMAMFMHNTNLYGSTLYAEPVFSDVTGGDVVRLAVESGWSAGIIKGHDGEFFPFEPVKREHMASFLVRLARYL